MYISPTLPSVWLYISISEICVLMVWYKHVCRVQTHQRVKVGVPVKLPVAKGSYVPTVCTYIRVLPVVHEIISETVKGWVRVKSA